MFLHGLAEALDVFLIADDDEDIVGFKDFIGAGSGDLFGAALDTDDVYPVLAADIGIGKRTTNE